MFDIKPITSPKPTDCGATCMKMLLAYYGQDVPLETLVKECNTRIIGCSAKDLMECGKKHGMNIKPWKREDEEEDGLSSNKWAAMMDVEWMIHIDRPAIIWWQYVHWVVFCGIDEDGKMVINNPDRGRFRMNKETFACFFTGVALTNGEPADLPTGGEAL